MHWGRIYRRGGRGAGAERAPELMNGNWRAGRAAAEYIYMTAGRAARRPARPRAPAALRAATVTAEPVLAGPEWQPPQ